MRKFIIYCLALVGMAALGVIYLRSKNVNSVCIYNTKNYIGLSKSKLYKEQKCVEIPQK